MTGRDSDQSSECRRMCACRRNAASPVPSAPGKQLARRTRGAAAWALPSVALVLVPKCPMCIAAYLALGGGLGISLSTAAHLRTALLWLCWSALALLSVRVAVRFAKRGAMKRMTTGLAAAARVALRNRAADIFRIFQCVGRGPPHLHLWLRLFRCAAQTTGI